MKRKNPPLAAWLAAGWCAVLLTQLQAQTPQLENDFRNVFSQQPAGQWPPPAPGIDVDPRVPTPNQFRSGTAFGGWKTTRILGSNGQVLAGGLSEATGETALRLPAGIPKDGNGVALPGEGVQLEYANLARTLVGREPTVFFGDVIPRPSVDENGQPVDPIAAYLAEPDNAAAGAFYYSPHARAVFATQAGNISITWRFRDPNRVPQTLTLSYTVSAAPAPGREAKRVFWTEKGFNGPLVNIPNGPIAAVNVRYNTQFPAQVTTEYDSPYDVPADPSVQLPPEKRTLWFSNVDSTLHAYNLEGRVFVEFLGAEDRESGQRQYLGSEVVEVIREVTPLTVNVHVGARILPHDGDSSLEGLVVNGLGGAEPFVHMHAVPSRDEVRFFSIRTTTPTDPPGRATGEVVLFWLRKGQLNIRWPKYYDTYVSTWPDDLAAYSLYARQDAADGDASATGVTLDGLNNSALVFQDDPTGGQAQIINGNLFYTSVTVTDPEGRALIRHTNGESIWFERVFSRLDTTYAGFQQPLTADIGARIEAPTGHESALGYIRQTTGTSFDPTAYIDPFTNSLTAARQGAIIPVNTIPGNDHLEVWWYKRSTPPATEAGLAGNYWPSSVQKYRLQWPSAPEKIVMASNAGTGELSSRQAAGRVYYQNDDTQPGFNPNDEHAMMLSGRAWALRDDLGTVETSLPYVLVRYTETDSRPAIRVFQVMREDPANGIFFHYDAVAGKVLQAPMPLPILPPVFRAADLAANEEVEPLKADTPDNADAAQHYRKFTYTDRKGTVWVYRGPHDGESELPFAMRYYYAAQEGFYVPGAAQQPIPGDPMPYLRSATATGYSGSPTGIGSQSLSIYFTPLWPDNAPVLLLGETLTLPTKGLPAVRGQTSATVLYDQARAASPDEQAVILIDPTVAKKSALADYDLDELPASVFTNDYRGRIYFPNLPPHLVQRFYYDPNEGLNGVLVYKGEFKDELFGEDFLHLNVLNAKDLADLKALCNNQDLDYAKWVEAIDGLLVTLQAKKEDPEKPGTFIPVEELSAGAVTAVWNWISSQAWRNLAAVPTVEDIQRGAAGVTLNPEELATTHDWLERHFNDLVAWDRKRGGVGGSSADQYMALRSRFITQLFPAAPPFWAGTAETTAYNTAKANAQALLDWVLSASRQWSTNGVALIEDDLVNATGGGLDAVPLAQKQQAWDFVEAHRSLLAQWDAGTADPDDVAAEIAAALRTDFETNEAGVFRQYGTEEPAEVTGHDVPVDSYSLAASGGGVGWVVVLAGDSKVLTPAVEPVSMHVFRVANPLGRGELKVVQPSNPLSEKLTLQQSLDYAGHPEEFEFEWRYLPPVDGQPPDIYNFQRRLVVGDGAWTQTAASGALSNVSLPGPITINAGDGSAGPKLARSFTLAEAPFRAFVSLNLGQYDGARISINGVQVALWNLAGEVNSTIAQKPLTSFDPLNRLFEVPVSAFNGVGKNNVIEVELSTTASAGTASILNVRVETMVEQDLSSQWLLVTPLPGEATGDMVGSIQSKNRHVIEGNSIFTLTDNYFICRYRARDTEHAGYDANGGWSKWTDPQLAEGWIKRALAGINPFEQRVKDLFNNEVNTDVSLITQAGKRWEGDVALNLENINSFGLIEIYETILRRGKALSIEGTPGINYGPANDALLLAAGYLNDLYMLVGNEAYADAANPTIAFSTESGITGDVATSLFAFKGQFATVLDEELALLRGRDDFLTPGTRVTPVFNRMVWNYTRGIDSGEAIYALNYNMKDLDSDGVVGAADAAKAFPQGHGDAYGHYLTALTNYYSLLWNSNFDWTPRVEAVLVLGKPVTVDYLDERKFATAAAAWTRTAAQTVELTYRAAYNPASENNPTWDHLSDARENTSTGNTRRWGVDDWAVRGGQGALFHWITANSTLPAEDPDPSHEGIQKIDRTTVPELAEIVSQSEAVQRALDTADARLNPLGLSGGAVPFDISPAEVDAGKTHYEQVFNRAVDALRNAVLAFNNAKNSTQLLRSQEDSLAKARDAIQAQERAFEAQLIDLYGTPYPEDIGPGKTFVQDYDGPDLVHYMYVDTPELFHDFSENGNDGEPFTLTLDQEFRENDPLNPIFNRETAEVFLSPAGQFLKPDEFIGNRAHPGRIQTAISELLAARVRLRHALEDYADFELEMRRLLAVYEASLSSHNRSIERQDEDFRIITGLKTAIGILETVKDVIGLIEESTDDILNSILEAMPKSVGLAVDATAPARGIARVAAAIGGFIIDYGGFMADLGIRGLTFGIETREALTGIELERIAWSAENAQWIYDLKSAFLELEDTGREVDKALRAYDQAERNLRTVTSLGRRVQDEREVFRQKAAALVQGYRTKDLGFRVFRNEALESYKSLFDLASRYTYMAAKAYDYETGLVDAAGNATANTFLQKIVSSRAVGVFTNNLPQPAGSQGGDPGLSGALARMNSDWAVVKSRFGFNNPDRYRTVFSLRREKERIINGVDGDTQWRDILASAKMDNILDDEDVRRFCQNVNPDQSLTVPGFVIPFESTIAARYNFFGKPLAGGDSAYSPSSFATKIRSTGIAFPGYIGMAAPTSIGGSISGTGAQSPSDPPTGFTDPNALSATPYIYVIPAGVDSIRVPASQDSNLVRTWQIEDQAIPLPFDIGGAFSSANVITSGGSLSEAFTIRKHQAFRAVPDGTVFTSAPGFTNARLIGRSVWNSNWKIIIPGYTLHSNPSNGMKTFEATVKDILIHFETYSYSGN